MSAVLLSGNQDKISQLCAQPEKRSLPKAGRLGALLDEADDMLRIDRCLSDSPCQRIGLRRGDRFLTINGEPVTCLADLRELVWNKQPGDTVTLAIQRKRWFRQPQELVYEIELK